ncbi:MAG: beta-N-acetylhexosaminidase [Pseudomonadota bacterium]|jgi:beta-N-acetylhexosaminidase
MHSPLIIDVAGLSLTKKDRERLAHPLVGGMILFGRNWHSREQVLELCAQVKSVRSDLLITVDHEGGRVQRFKTDGFTHLPAMQRLGQRWFEPRTGESPSDAAMAAMSAASAVGMVLASELLACGVDMSFAPVLDLHHGHSVVIGDRSFDRDPKVVSLLGRALMQGLLQVGMSNCGKHFPGHGYVAADSHVDVPVDERSLDQIMADDARPFEWLASVTRSIMPAHVIYPQVDDLPAGFSSRWLQDILRGKLGFDGAIFSDDLSMEGARHLRGQQLDYAQAGALALQAGCDLVLLCNQSVADHGQVIDDWLKGMEKALKRGDWQLSEDSERRRLSLLPTQPPMSWDELMCAPHYLTALEQVMDL